MAKEENKNTKPSFGQRFINFFTGIGRSFKNMFHEHSVVVFVFMIVMGVIIGVFDLGAGALIKLITG